MKAKSVIECMEAIEREPGLDSQARWGRLRHLLEQACAVEEAAQQSVQRTCPHAETFIDPVSGYVTCMACDEPLHEASR